jgi:hypothetical protein
MVVCIHVHSAVCSWLLPMLQIVDVPVLKPFSAQDE